LNNGLFGARSSKLKPSVVASKIYCYERCQFLWWTNRNDETSYIGKKKSKIIELDEIAYTELILLIDIKASSGKVAFSIIRG
jgi:hypothetical protein